MELELIRALKCGFPYVLSNAVQFVIFCVHLSSLYINRYFVDSKSLVAHYEFIPTERFYYFIGLVNETVPELFVITR